MRGEDKPGRQNATEEHFENVNHGAARLRIFTKFNICVLMCVNLVKPA
jgi:hypothetical protein